ncbi:MAG: hypothetical protein AB7P03_16475 [Kofleriaceae bacterium]
MRELDDRLLRGGCARGPRRAVAHIGVELLLDGVLVEDSEFRDAYTLGIEYDAQLLWRDEGDAERYAALIVRLRSHGVPYDLQRPEAIGLRLSRMLAHRPLLAPSSADLDAINMALFEYKPRVEVAADTVMRSLRAALG